MLSAGVDDDGWRFQKAVGENTLGWDGNGDQVHGVYGWGDLVGQKGCARDLGVH